MSNIFENKGAFGATIVVAASDSLKNRSANYICDGVNDHVEIQAALDALPATGGEVLLLDGTYNIEVQIDLDTNQTLRGCGTNTILTTATANLVFLSAIGVALTEKTGIVIADLQIDGGAGGISDRGIYFEYVDYSFIQNVYSRRHATAAGYGIYLSYSDFNRLANNICQDNKNGTILYISSNNTISGSIYRGNITEGIYIFTSDSNTITGNVCVGNLHDGISIFSTSKNNTITGNTLQNNPTGIYCDASSGNTISGNTFQGNSNSIYIYNGTYNTITGNTIQGNTLDVAIYINAGSNNTLSGNTVQGSTLEGIILLSTNSNIVIGNTCIANSQGTDNTSANIKLDGADYNHIIGNICRRGVLANKAKYGIEIDADSNKNILSANDLYDSGSTANLIDDGVCTIVQDDNRDIAPIQVKHLIYAQNTSGGNLLIGNIVSYEAAAGTVGFETPTAIGDPKVWGMLVENIDWPAYGYIQVLGGTIVMDATNVGGGAIAIGDLLCSEVGVRARKAGAGDMAFAIALEGGDAGNMVIDALIITPRMI